MLPCTKVAFDGSPAGLQSVVEEQIYPNVTTGFTDSNAYLRELTLKSMLTLAPKLSQRTLSNSLLKFLAKLQVGLLCYILWTPNLSGPDCKTGRVCHYLTTVLEVLDIFRLNLTVTHFQASSTSEL